MNAMVCGARRDEGFGNKAEKRSDKSVVDMMARVSRAGKNDKGSTERAM
jgi:hypothetical protein